MNADILKIGDQIRHPVYGQGHIHEISTKTKLLEEIVNIRWASYQGWIFSKNIQAVNNIKGVIMNIETAKQFLDTCVRMELRDHAFGDVEVLWALDAKSDNVGGGYFGDSSTSVWIDSDPPVSFSGDEARKLRNCGTLGEVDRNDSTGPDIYNEGVAMSGLTKEGVFDELNS